MNHGIRILGIVAISAVVLIGAAHYAISAASGQPAVSDVTGPNMLAPDCVAEPERPKSVLTPIDEKLLLSIKLPCAEAVSSAPASIAAGQPLDTKPTALENLQRGFDFYSWLTFIALNAPADGSKIAEAKSTTPSTWEDIRNFKQLGEVMRPGGIPPEPWGQRLTPPECLPNPGRQTIFYMIEESFDQPFKSGPLIDQNGNYAVFDILMNKQMYDLIVKLQFYRKATQQHPNNPDDFVRFPSGENQSLPVGTNKGTPGDVGAIMLKVSWKKLSPAEASSGKFHMQNVRIYRAAANGHPATCSAPVQLGLIGMHIVHKTINRKQWIWTSFEHVENVPEQKDVDNARNAGQPTLEGHYSFFNPNTLGVTPNQLPLRPWAPDDKLAFAGSFRSQITRTIPLTAEVRDLNAQFGTKLLGASVWKNYMLISTQWPSDFTCAGNDTTSSNEVTKQPDATCIPAPTFLANSTLETFSQGDIPIASSSCMSCHNNAVTIQRPAKQSDFTFMFEKAQ